MKLSTVCVPNCPAPTGKLSTRKRPKLYTLTYGPISHAVQETEKY